MKRKVIYQFKDTTETGIDVVPNNVTVLIKDVNGELLNVFKVDNTGMDSNSTIADFLADGTLYKKYIDESMYKADGTLTGDRVVDAANHQLEFKNLDMFTLGGTSLQATMSDAKLHLSGAEVKLGTFDQPINLEVASGTENITFKTPNADQVVLTEQPTGNVDLAISTTKYVDDKVLDGVTASNGVHENGTDIRLGGALIEDTKVTSDSATFDIKTTNGNSEKSRLQVYTPNASIFMGSIADNGDENYIKTEIDKVTLSSDAGDVKLGALEDKVILTTQPTGAVELAVATTKYVDDSVSNNITASNGIHEDGDDIRLGGALIEDTEVDAAGFDMHFKSDDTGEFSIGHGVGTDFYSIALHASNNIDIGCSGDIVIDSSGDIAIEPEGDLTLGYYDSEVTLKSNTEDKVVLTTQPTGTVDLAVATTKYVNDTVGTIHRNKYVMDGTTDTLTLTETYTVGEEEKVDVYVGGVFYDEFDDYSLSDGDKIKFTDEPSENTKVIVKIIK